MNTNKNMHKSKRYKRAEESIYGWYAHLNEVLGVLAITLGFSALSSNITAELATFSLVLICFLGVSKASTFDVKENQNIFKKVWGNFKSNIISLWKTSLFMLGITFLVLIASGIITQEDVKGYSIHHAAELLSKKFGLST